MTTVSVTDLVLNFSAACRALVPGLDYAQVPCRDDEHYDNFDRVFAALFETLVIEPCVFAAVGEAGQNTLSIARYGFSGALQTWNAWVALQGAPVKRLIQLLDKRSTFRPLRDRR
jgi:hypothetical protein